MEEKRYMIKKLNICYYDILYEFLQEEIKIIFKHIFKKINIRCITLEMTNEMEKELILKLKKLILIKNHKYKGSDSNKIDHFNILERIDIFLKSRNEIFFNF